MGKLSCKKVKESVAILKQIRQILQNVRLRFPILNRIEKGTINKKKNYTINSFKVPNKLITWNAKLDKKMYLLYQLIHRNFQNNEFRSKFSMENFKNPTKVILYNTILQLLYSYLCSSKAYTLRILIVSLKFYNSTKKFIQYKYTHT